MQCPRKQPFPPVYQHIGVFQVPSLTLFHSGSLISASFSKFGNEGASVIESSLQSNNSLTKLKIAENGTHLLLSNGVV